MNRTAVVFSPIYYQHNAGRGHPESARRLQRIVTELQKCRLPNNGNWRFVKPERACLKDVELVHGREYIQYVEKTCRIGGSFLDVERDTVVSPESYHVALYAVGGTLEAVNLVMKTKTQNAFALVRPPGHHAGRYRAQGFCIFNNVAIAAKYLLREFNLKKVLVLDIDAHHGNGTQEIFYTTNRVVYIGLHQDPREFPGTGFTDEVGKGEGLGYTINIPLPYNTNDEVYLKAMNEIVKPIVLQYKPQFILVSAGLDGHYSDPVANLSLSTRCYRRIYEMIVHLASRTCQGKLVSVLEGGYSLNFVGKIASTVIGEMNGTSFEVEDKIIAAKESIRKQGEKVIDKTKQIQGSFWNV